MRIFLDQIGCRLNYSEMETLAQRLRVAGHQTVNEPELAQVIVFNSCAVTAGAERDSRKRVGALHRANAAARIAVTGCLATLDPQRTATLPGVALVAPNDRKDLLHTLLEPWSAELDDPADLTRMHPDGDPFTFDAFVPEPAPLAYARGSDDAPLHPLTLSPPHPLSPPCRPHARVRQGTRRLRQPLHLLYRHRTARGEPQPAAGRGGRGDSAVGRQRRQGGCAHRRAPGQLRARSGRCCNAATSRSWSMPSWRDTDITRLRLSSLEPWELAGGFFDLWARWPGRLCPHLHLPLAGRDRPPVAQHGAPLHDRQLSPVGGRGACRHPRPDRDDRPDCRIPRRDRARF